MQRWLSLTLFISQIPHKINLYSYNILNTFPILHPDVHAVYQKISLIDMEDFQQKISGIFPFTFSWNDILFLKQHKLINFLCILFNLSMMLEFKYKPRPRMKEFQSALKCTYLVKCTQATNMHRIKRPHTAPRGSFHFCCPFTPADLRHTSIPKMDTRNLIWWPRFVSLLHSPHYIYISPIK
jgi:hypothetical protein